MRTSFSAHQWGGVRLHFLQSSASIRGSVSPRDNVGGSPTPRTNRHFQAAYGVPHSRRRSKQWRRRLVPSCTSEPSASSTMDLGDQLSKEEGTDQVIPHWQSKQIIASALADYICSSPTKAKSLFEHMSNSSS